MEIYLAPIQHDPDALEAELERFRAHPLAELESPEQLEQRLEQSARSLWAQIKVAKFTTTRRIKIDFRGFGLGPDSAQLAVDILGRLVKDDREFWLLNPGVDRVEFVDISYGRRR